MLIRTAKDNDIKQIRALWNQCFNDDSTQWINWYFQHTYKPNNVECLFVEDKLVSMVHLNPYNLYMNGKHISAVAMAGVATNDEHRKKGFAAILIEHSIKKAYEKGYEYSFLYPFNYEFYEKFGYKLAYMKYSYEQKFLCNDIPLAKIFIEENFNNNELMEIYKEFCKNQNGFVVRDEVYTKKHIEEYLVDRYKLVSFSLGEEKGYYVYSDNNPNQIEEIAFTGEMSKAYESISGYFKKDIMFLNQYKNDVINMKVESHCMGRVINAKKFLSNMDSSGENIRIGISDSIIKENNFVWQINKQDGITKVERTLKNADLIMDIGKLPPIFTGLKIESNQHVEKINKVFAIIKSPYIIEVC